MVQQPLFCSRVIISRGQCRAEAKIQLTACSSSYTSLGLPYAAVRTIPPDACLFSLIM